jgi:hypothetical protein
MSIVRYGDPNLYPEVQERPKKELTDEWLFGRGINAAMKFKGSTFEQEPPGRTTLINVF